MKLKETQLLACEQGEGRGGERRKGKREGKGESVRLHQYFDCRSFIIYAGPSFNYSNMHSNNNNNYGPSGNPA